MPSMPRRLASAPRTRRKSSTAATAMSATPRAMMTQVNVRMLGSTKPEQPGHEQGRQADDGQRSARHQRHLPVSIGADREVEEQHGNAHVVHDRVGIHDATHEVWEVARQREQRQRFAERTGRQARPAHRGTTGRNRMPPASTADTIWLEVTEEAKIPAARQALPNRNRPAVAGSHRPDVGISQHQQDDGIVESQGQHAAEHRQAAEELAQHDLDISHRHREQQLPGAELLLLRHQPHGEHRREQQDEKLGRVQKAENAGVPRSRYRPGRW